MSIREDDGGRAPQKGRRTRRAKEAARGLRERLLDRLLARLPGAQGAPLPDWGARPYRVLYMRHERIGDMIIVTGVIRAIARSHPTISVDVICSPENARVLRGNPDVRQLLVLDKKRWLRGKRWWQYLDFLRRVRRGSYDVFIDGRHFQIENRSTTRTLMLAAAAPYRFGFVSGKDARAEALYTHTITPDPREPVVEQFGEFAEFFGVDRSRADLRPALYVDERERALARERWAQLPGPGPRLLVNLSAGDWQRRWADEHFVEALRRARAAVPSTRMLVISHPSEAASAESVAAAIGASWGLFDLDAAFALVATADLVLTPDTAISHASAALGTPAVVMVPFEVRAYAPYKGEGITVFSDEGYSLASLPPERVAAALETTLRRVGAAGPTR